MTCAITNLNFSQLPEKSYTSSTYNELSFDIYDENGNALNVSWLTFVWKLCPFGSPTTISLSKTGIYRDDLGLTNRFTVYLYNSDTASLSGKYIQQPILSGFSEDYEFRLGQGYINFIPVSGLL